MLCLVSSCGLIDVDPDTEGQIPTKMYFVHDTVYVMVGDSFVVRPKFEPDSIKNKSLIWNSREPEVVSLWNDTLVAEQEGWAHIEAMSVSAMVRDSLKVCVMEPWEISPTLFPYEMVVYADVSVHGKPMTEDMTLGAFSGVSFRGLGEPIDVRGKRIWRIRVYNDFQSTLPYAETLITFWVYDRSTLQRMQFPVYITYNGETYSTPSEPLELKIE